MMPTPLIPDTKRLNLDRDQQTADMADTLTELYGDCHCGLRPAPNPVSCAYHAVDPDLYRRAIWAGLGA